MVRFGDIRGGRSITAFFQCSFEAKAYKRSLCRVGAGSFHYSGQPTTRPLSKSGVGHVCRFVRMRSIAQKILGGYSPPAPPVPTPMPGEPRAAHDIAPVHWKQRWSSPGYALTPAIQQYSAAMLHYLVGVNTPYKHRTVLCIQTVELVLFDILIHNSTILQAIHISK